jgi:beta-barrel assembly-enhancing protease
MVRHELGNLNGARGDLQASIDACQPPRATTSSATSNGPPATASSAIENYRIAAQADGEIGRRARQALTEMGVE